MTFIFFFFCYNRSDFFKGVLMVKDFVIKFGRLILDVIVVASFVIALISSLVMMFSVGFFFGLSSLIGSFIALFLSFFVIYLVIDIRDALVNKA